VIQADGRDWYTANEINGFWPDVSPAAIRQWASRGKLNGHRIGRRTYYDLDHVQEVEQEQRPFRHTNQRVVC
jgi:hypothetical protein